MITARLTKTEKTRLNLSEECIEYFRQDPVYAAKAIFNVDLTWFQRLILKRIWTKNFNLVMLGRGLGKTWIAALSVALYGVLYPRTKIGIIAPVFRQVGYFFDYLQELYDNSEYFRACCKKRIIRNMNREYLEFVNGSFIEGLPLGDGNKVRGRRYNFVVIDEYAFVPEEIIKLVIRPMLNIMHKDRANKLLISSTAYYSWNHFYNQYILFQVMQYRKPDLYAVSEYIYTDLMRIENPPYRIDENMLNMAKADTTKEQFEMENLCRFPTEGEGFFSMKLIDDCTPKRDDGSPIELKGRTDREYVLGIDAARVAGGDNFALELLRLDGNVKRLVFAMTLNGQSYPIMMEAIRTVLKNFNVVRILMDKQGGGMAIYDLLSQPWIDPHTGQSYLPVIDMEDKNDERAGLRILKLVSPTKQLNNEFYHVTKSEMEHSRLLFPITLYRNQNGDLEKVNNEINQTKQEMSMLVTEGTGNGLTFEAPQGRKKDRVTALVLACNAARDYLFVPKPPQPTLAVGTWVKR